MNKSMTHAILQTLMKLGRSKCSLNMHRFQSKRTISNYITNAKASKGYLSNENINSTLQSEDDNRENLMKTHDSVINICTFGELRMTILF